VDELRVDASDLKRLAASIDHTVAIVPAKVRAVVQKGALNIKKDAQRRVGRGPYIRRYASAITYDTQETPTGASAEIGPDKNKAQGALGNLLEYEYGTPWSAPRPHLGPALEAEAPRFEQALEDAIVEAVLGW
jgi:hypothetical protein